MAISLPSLEAQSRHDAETKAGLEAILSAITALNQGERCKDSLEFGTLAGGRLKVYFDASEPVEAEMLMRNALMIRARTLREIEISGEKL